MPFSWAAAALMQITGEALQVPLDPLEDPRAQRVLLGERVILALLGHAASLARRHILVQRGPRGLWAIQVCLGPRQILGQLGSQALLETRAPYPIISLTAARPQLTTMTVPRSTVAAQESQVLRGRLAHIMVRILSYNSVMGLLQPGRP